MANFIEFPVFDGVSGELRPWISWLEDFFVREKFTALEKMNLAQSLLEGEAEAWFYRIQKTMIFYSWKELKDKLLLRFGDFADSDRLRLIAEQDRFLQEIRDEARIQRMKTTSIPVKDSIWETVPEALVPTDTIPVPNWIEPRDSILATQLIQETNSDPVMDGGEVIDFIQDIESSSANESKKEVESPGNRLSANKQTGTVSTYVTELEELSVHVIEQQTVSKEESITLLQVPVSKLEHSLQIHNESPNVCENYQDVVGCDELGNEESMFSGLSHTSHVWEPGGVLADHVLVDWFMDFPGYDGIVDGIRCLAIGVCSGIIQPIDSRRASRVWERGGLDISAALTDWLMQCYKGFEFSRLMRELHQIDLQWVRRKHLVELCVGHGLLVFPWNLMLLEFFLFIHLEDTVCLAAASNSYYGWMVFDRGRNNIISRDVIALMFLDLKKCFFQGAEKRDVQMMLLVEANDAQVDSLMCGDVKFFLKHKWRFKYKSRLKKLKLTKFTKFLCETVHRVSCLSLAAQFNSLEIIQAVLEQIIQRDEEASTKTIDKLQTKLKQRMDLHGASWHCSLDEMNQFHSPIGLVDALHPGLGEAVHTLPATEQKIASIWHRWRRKD